MHLWNLTSDTDCQYGAVQPSKILNLQKKVIRILAHLTPTESCRESFKTLGILTVVCLYIHNVIIYTYQQDYNRGENIHSYNTRRARLHPSNSPLHTPARSHHTWDTNYIMHYLNP
ncbi:hypothetical protein J6590_108224 [Homalodisca vitripennis]|nr:hypothetical protein J6590_108224 [Homalodisca vitripennis]